MIGGYTPCPQRFYPVYSDGYEYMDPPFPRNKYQSYPSYPSYPSYSSNPSIPGPAPLMESPFNNRYLEPEYNPGSHSNSLESNKNIYQMGPYLNF